MLCGSLRVASINRRLLEAVSLRAPHGVRAAMSPDLGALPLFNPDIEHRPPQAVHTLLASVDAADGLLIASPEYAHGVTGTIKNCLDWLVGGHEFVEKPVAVLNAAPRAHHALDALKETIRTMNGYLVEEASLLIPVANRRADAAAIAADPEFSVLIDRALSEFVAAIRRRDMS